MVAASRLQVILACVSVSLFLAPAAAALGGDPGLVVAETTPLRVSDLPLKDATPEPAPTPERVVRDVADAASTRATPVVTDAAPVANVVLVTAIAPEAPDTAELLATLADSGRAPEDVLALVPALTALAEDAPATVTALAPALAVTRAPAVATGLAGAALVSFVLPPVPAARLYSRIRSTDVLEHPVRRQVYERIRQEPGVHANRLKDDVGIGNGTLVYHLDVLLRERLVTKVDAGRFTRFFAAGSMSPREMRSRATLLAGSGEKIFDLVTERPGVAVKELAAETGLSVPAVHRALARLESAGLVEKRREGRGHALYPNPESPLVAA